MSADTISTSGVDVNAVISDLAGASIGIGVIGGYCEDGFPFFYANNAMVAMLGYADTDDLVQGIDGMVGNMIHPDDTPQVLEDIGPEYYEGLVYETQYRMKRKNGSWFWTTDRGKVVRADDGRLAILSVCSDMTDFMRRHAELERQMSQNLEIINALGSEYSNLFLINIETGAYTHFRVDETGMHKPAIDAARMCENYHDGLAAYIERFVAEDDRERMLEQTTTAALLAATPESGIHSIGYKRIDGDATYHYQLNSAKFTDDNGVQFLVLGFRDVNDIVSEQIKQADLLRDALMAAEHANRAKTTFLNNMSHDIRTPMNAIMGYTALAAAHIDNPEQVRDYLSKITTSSSHLLSLINDVLDMSRIESGKVNIEEKDMSLPDVMHDIRTIMQANVNAKQLDFLIDTVDVIHEHVICDSLRLEQVLLNMLSNTVKFTKPGGTMALRIIEKPCSSSGYAHYEFHVKDNGIGMSQEFQKHIFEPFTREKNSTVSGIQGTGLGMAITKNIVDMMGGEITVSSKLGVGSEFVVSLDCKISCEPVEQGVIEEMRGMRALVADDDSHTAISVSNMLKSVGLRSDWTLSGKEAVLRARVAAEEADEYAAYIIDWLMPDMNGIETVRQIRRHISNDSVPIIVLTAYDWGEIEAEAREAGVTGFVSKPIFMSELRHVLVSAYETRDALPSSESPAFDAMLPAYEDEKVEGTRVLLVEDNATNQEIAQAILEQHGIVVSIARDGDEAVDAMRQADAHTYDLVFMDIQMPRMNGYDATRAIRNLGEVGRQIPIVAMTANAFEEDRALAMQAGMNDYVTKPIDVGQLLGVIEKYVHGNEQ